jgi:hypothetical protein
VIPTYEEAIDGLRDRLFAREFFSGGPETDKVRHDIALMVYSLAERRRLLRERNCRTLARKP